jgi:hypothetical protein
MLQDTKMACEAYLVVLRQRLASKQDNEALVPGTNNLRHCPWRNILPEIDADDFSA